MLGKKGKMFFIAILLVFITLLVILFANTEKLAGLVSRFAPDDLEVFAQDYIRAICLGEFETAIDLMADEAKSNRSLIQLKQISEYLTKAETIKFDLIGCNIVESSDRKRCILSYQLQTKDDVSLLSIFIEERNGTKKVSNLNIKKTARPLEELNSLALEEKTFIHFIFLVVGLALVLFTFYTAAVCFESVIKRKWLWIIFILTGICVLYFNWTTGNFIVRLFALIIPVMGISKASLYAPWIFSISIPVGSIVFWFKHGSDKRRKNDLKEEMNYGA